MDAALLEELEMQHRQVEELLEQLSQAEDEGTQRPLVEQLVQMLQQHMELEETMVYPEVSNVDEELEEEAEAEHRLGREGIAMLQEMVGQPGFGAAVAMLEAGIAHHVEEEEGEVFPKLRESLGIAAPDATKQDLYERARAAGIAGRSTMTKEQLAEALEGAR